MKPAQLFAWSLWWLALSASLGALLRWLPLQPLPGLNAAHLLHTHSHLAFLGWVFNACLALALYHFVPATAHSRWRRLVLGLQVAVVGMALSYPLQGYGAVSIAFSSLHMVLAAVVAARLWRGAQVSDAAQPHLRIALAAMVLSGLGPLCLGPLAALDLRDSAAYPLSIYGYVHLHAQGWFLFFLQAIVLHRLGENVDLRAARQAARWLGAGLVLTLAQSTLWLQPATWVWWVAGAGGGAQLVGCYWFLRAIRGAQVPQLGSTVFKLAGVALGCWLLKHILQAAMVVPALAAIASSRFMAIAFLHLVFLGVATPALLAMGSSVDWLKRGIALKLGLGLLLVGAIWGEFMLITPPLGVVWTATAFLPMLATSATLTALGAIFIAINGVVFRQK